MYLINFDQSFPADTTPEAMLGTPAEYAPEVAVGEKASDASNVWSLTCTIFRLRSGHTPFHEYEVTSPIELLRFVVQRLGQDLPHGWQDIRFNDVGQPASDESQG